MQKETFQTPIAMIVFNRPRQTRLVFDAIANIRPARLLVIADGPRPDRPGESDLCQEVRAIVQEITWPCELMTNFAEVNLGCQERVISGLDWVFSLVEEAIILEDDCLPDQTFFAFCQELLERYRGDSRIGMISGDNFTEHSLHTDYSYYFSQMTSIWGWATWKSAWARYDRHLKDWPEIRRANLLSEIFDSAEVVRLFTSRFDEMHARTGPNTWDHQWTYTNLINNSLSIGPRVNLVTNIGFGPDATHTICPSSMPAFDSLTWPLHHPLSAFTPDSKSLTWPLRHPPTLLPLRSMDRRYQRLQLPLGFIPAKIKAVRRRFSSWI